MALTTSRRSVRLLFCLVLLAALSVVSSCATMKEWVVGKDKKEVARSYYDRAMGYMDTRQYTQAEEDLRRAITEDPDMYQAYYQLGLAYRAQNKEKEAREVWTMGVGRAQRGPERLDYPRSRALAEMLAALEGKKAAVQKVPTPMTPPPPRPAPTPRPAPKPTITQSRPANAPMGDYAVLVSSNLKRYHALADQKRLEDKGYSTKVTSFKDKRGRTWYRVWAGCCTTLPRAKSLALEIKRRGLSRDATAMRAR
jgi:tetratricopeptide (TPR) repeat protein